MIKALIFDFGDVFINLDKSGTIQRGKALFGKDIITEAKNDLEIFRINDDYEKGLIPTQKFIEFYTELSEDVTDNQFITLWNSLIKDFPLYRLDFIKRLSARNDYLLILLSNTNDLHIDYIKENIPFYDEFKSCFDKFYLSQEIHLRKPNSDIFQFVLQDNNLDPNECLFIDDTKQNTDAAKSMGIHIWNIDETKEDVVDLFKIKEELF